jgi:hypothetical protein
LNSIWYPLKFDYTLRDLEELLTTPFMVEIIVQS